MIELEETMHWNHGSDWACPVCSEEHPIHSFERGETMFCSGCQEMYECTMVETVWQKRSGDG